MTKNFSRLVGFVLVLSALIALWFYLPGVGRARVSKSGIALMTTSALRQIALSYLAVGLAAGFGLAMLVWSFVKEKR